MLYSGNPNLEKAPEFEFYEPPEPRVKEPVTLYTKPKKKNAIKLYNRDVEGILSILRNRMQDILRPLYVFIGMVAAALGKSDDVDFYKWKMPVRTYKKDNPITIEQFFEYHQHIPNDVMNYVIMTYYFNKKEEPTKNIDEDTEEDNSIEYVPPKRDGGTPSGFRPVNSALIGNDYEDGSELTFLDGSPDKDIYQFVLSFSTTGALDMATEELNLYAGKDFTTREIIESLQVRHIYAQFVAARFATARSGNYNSKRIVFVSQTFKHKTSQSKWAMGAKIWWQTVYRRVNRIDRYDDKIASLRDSIIEKDQELLDMDDVESPEYRRTVQEYNILYRKIWDLEARARPQLYKSQNRRYML